LGAAFAVLGVTDSLADDSAYSCKDRSGQALTGSGPPANECDRDICRYTHGVKTCEDDPPEDATGSIPDAKAHEQFLSDAALLDRYKNEAQLADARSRSLAPIQSALDDATKSLETAEREREGPLNDQLEFYKGRTLPPALVDQVNSNEQAQQLAKKSMQDCEREIRRLNGVFDQQLSRLRTLWKNAHVDECRKHPSSVDCRDK
jgi:hypothetical protein